jgi:hypothetical protein
MALPDFPDTSSPENSPSAAPQRSRSRYEPTLVPRLVGTLKSLNARFSELAGAIERDPSGNASALEECVRQFTAVRHIETSWLHPLLEQAVAGDSAARSQLAELRLVGLILARRVQRCFDELAQAVRAEVLVAVSATRLETALTKYSNHSERAVYPLYELLGSERMEAAEVA